MLLYVITLFLMLDDLRASEPGLITPLFADDTVFDRFAQNSAQLLKLLLDRSTDSGYLPEPSKSFFISEILNQEKVANMELKADALNLNFVGGRRYLGDYLGPRE